MSELWAALTAPGADFPVSCLSRRTEKWSKVVGTFYEDGTVFPFPKPRRLLMREARVALLLAWSL